MDILDAAGYFNQMECLDGYTGHYLFDAQLALYDDNKRDSETAGRRVISIDDGIELPPRRVIAAAGTRFILGHRNVDDFQGSSIRLGYVGQEAPYLSQVRTLAEVTSGQPGFKAWAGDAWVKNMAFTEQSSKLTAQQHIHYSQTERVAEGNIVTLANRIYVIRATSYGTSGMLVCTAEELAQPVIETALITNGGRDPITDALIEAPTSATVVRVRWQSLFTYGSQTAPSFDSGDIQLAVSKVSLTVKPGARVQLSDGVWNISSVSDAHGVWLCRAVRHA